MKLRIRGNTVRLRLTKTEVSNLSEIGSVEEKTDFGGGNYLVYAISASYKVKTVKADFTDNRLGIYLPIDVAKNWAHSDEVAISATQNSLKVLIEKDFNCFTLRNGEDDVDTFPHPN